MMKCSLITLHSCHPNIVVVFILFSKQASELAVFVYSIFNVLLCSLESNSEHGPKPLCRVIIPMQAE